MSTGTAERAKLPAWVHVLIAFVLAFDLTAAWQWFDGAFTSELGGHEDEARHYLAAASLRDAVGNGSLKTALPVAGDAPLFDAKLAGWMTLSGGGRLSVMLFMAMLAAANATLIFAVVRSACGLWAAGVAGIIWLCMPMVRASAEMILPEQMQALTLTVAALAWAQLARSPGWPIAAWFALSGLAAIFSAVPAGVVLVMVAAVPVMLRRPGVFRRPEAWVALLLVIVPLLFRGMPSIGWSSMNWAGVGRELLALPGFAVLGFALAAALLGARAWRHAEARSSGEPASGAPTVPAAWAACLAIIVAAAASTAIGGRSPADRALFVALPSLVILAAFGAVAIARASSAATLDGRERKRRAALWVLLLLLLALPRSLTSGWRKEWSGFGPIVDELLAQNPGATRVLVVSDRCGEGMLLTEAAMRDPERRLVIERGSEALAQAQNPSGDGKPTSQFLDDETLRAHLTAGKIRHVVLDSSVPYEGHAEYHDQVQRVLEDHPRQFWPVSNSPIIRGGEPQGHPLRIFRVVPADSALAPPSQ